MTRRKGTLILRGVDDSSAPVGAWLIVAPGTPGERRVDIGDTPLRIGSDPACDVRVVDPHVSRRHIEVKRGTDGVILRDLGSRNGTTVDGVAVKEVVLRGVSTVVIGKTQIRVETDVPKTTSHPPELDTEPELEGPAVFGQAVGSSAEMRRVFALLSRLAPTELTITLTGETGTGKDVLARGVHAASSRSEGPFVVFDCGAAAPTLIESELFGHEKGAFTGASTDRRGAFERAHGGTLFLDEVGELALELQPKLLRALEQRRVRRVGGAEDIEVDVRILAATNRDLEAEVRAGRFREDLFFRLSAAIVKVPSLRQRIEDVAELASAILAEGGRTLGISNDTLEVLKSYDWPGNVRELRNVLLGAAALAETNTLQPRDLMFFRPRRRDPTIDRLPLAGRSLESIERAAIEQTLKHAGGNKVKAAKTLGIAASTLYEKLKKYGLT
jgi:transcriptional regulator with PAS, ATPase and Fis domain